MHLCVWSRSTSGTDDLCEMNKNLLLAHELLEERYVAYKTKAEKCHVSQPLSVFIPGTLLYRRQTTKLIRTEYKKLCDSLVLRLSFCH